MNFKTAFLYGALIIFLMLSMPTLSFSQQDTSWNKWGWLIGEWAGEGSGTPGQGSGWFSFKPDLDGKILVRKSHSEYPAAQGRPASVHEDLMIVYPGNTGTPDSAIYFDNEGHTIHYAVTYPEQSVVMTSSKNGPAPIFRLSYVPLGKDTVNVKFEMSQDGKEFRTYIEGKSVKTK